MKTNQETIMQAKLKIAAIKKQITETPFLENKRKLREELAAEKSILDAASYEAKITRSQGQCVQFFDYPERGGQKGETVKNTLGNMQFMLDKCGIKLAFNCIKREVEASIPDVLLSEEDKDNDICTHLQSIAALNDMPEKSAVMYGECIARQTQRNPVQDWIESKPWDHQSRFEEFAETLEVQDGYPKERRNWILRLWMLAAMYGAIEAKTSHICMVLQGDQNQGKGGWINSLCPKNLELVKDGMQFNPRDKDCLILAAKYWIVELSEFDGAIRKSDAADLKAYLTQGEDNVRVSYARKHSKFKRRTAFIASVNDDQFLVDATGNRRYFTIKILKAHRNHKIDMQQMWAEVYTWYQAGQQPWATDEQIAESEKQNETLTNLNPCIERIISDHDWTAHLDQWQDHYQTATQVLQSLGIHDPKGGDTKAAGSFLTKKKVPFKTSNGCKRYQLPPKIEKLYDWQSKVWNRD